MLLTIAMPAYNEQDAIETVVQQALGILDRMGIEGEILILDDCSTDRTVDLVREMQKRDSRIRLLQNEVNRGVAGFERRLVTDAFGEWVFMGSSDGETDYDDVPRFLEIARSGSLNGVFGIRARKNYKLYRMFISWTYNTLVRACFRCRLQDAGWVKLFHREEVAAIPLYCQSAFVSAERLLAMWRLGLKYTEVPTRHLSRIGGCGRGGQLSWVIASFRDLLLTRLRWFAFTHYYGSPVRTR